MIKNYLKRVAVSVDITVATNEEEFTYLLFQILRNNDLLKYEDPHDDHPNLAMTSAVMRDNISKVVRKLIEVLPIDLVSA